LSGVITARVAVVGLGAFGSSALWRLAARGVDAVGIDRYGVGHHLGSTHGATRLFRIACQEHEGLTPIARASLRLWAELGERNGEEYVRQSGCLSTAAAHEAPVAGTLAAASAADVEVERLDAATLRSRFPQYGAIGDGTEGVWDPGAGICYPEKNVRAHVAEARRLGARVLTDTRVTGVELLEHGVRVRTSTLTIEAEQVILAAGAWNPKLLPGLPVRPLRMPLFWFRPREGARHSYELEDFPAFIHQLPGERLLWGHGAADGHGIKVGVDVDDDGFADTDADEVDRYIHPRNDAARLSSWVEEAFPELDPVPDKAIPCMITASPDGQFLVGRPGADPRVLLASGDHGHGFKHAAGIGELLAQLAVGEEPYCDASFLDPDRFEECAEAVAALPRGA